MCYRGNILHLQYGATPLYIACQNGHLPVVEHLIAAKANVNTPDEVGYLPNYGLSSPCWSIGSVNTNNFLLYNPPKHTSEKLCSVFT